MSDINFRGFGPLGLSGGLASDGSSSSSAATSWFQALAKAWGQALDRQAATLEGLAERINGGDDRPGTVALVSAESHKMMFLANSESTSVGAVGQALETMARKQ